MAGGKVERSWQLIKVSTGVLRDDGELLLLPLLSGVASLALAVAFIWEAMGDQVFGTFKGGDAPLDMTAVYIWLFPFYIVEYFVLIFFNTALVGAALDRLDGNNPTIYSALGIALRRFFPILGYAVLSATVGMVLRFIGERGGFIGRLITVGLEFAWTVGTFLVVPILVAEDAGPMTAIERSGELLKSTWGENITGDSSITFLTGFFSAIAALAGAGGWTLYTAGNTSLGIVVMGIAALVGIGTVVFGSALAAVYTAAVYYFAVLGNPPPGFDRDIVRGAFAVKHPTGELA